MRRTISPRAAVVVLVLSLAGCTSSSAGAPVPESHAAPSGVPEQLSPPVQSPRDVRAYGDDPCAVFTPEQLLDFGFDQPPRRPPALPSGHQVCTWTDSDDHGALGVITFPDSDILEREYANRAGYPVFEPIEIAGLPAIRRENIANGPRCVVVVGLAERQGINIEFTDRTEPYEDPCGAARIAAEVAVGNLPPLS